MHECAVQWFSKKRKMLLIKQHFASLFIAQHKVLAKRFKDEVIVKSVVSVVLPMTLLLTAKHDEIHMGETVSCKANVQHRYYLPYIKNRIARGPNRISHSPWQCLCSTVMSPAN